MVQDLRHVLRLTQVMRHAAVPRAEGAFGARAGRVAVRIIVGVHAWRFVSPPHGPLLQDREKSKVLLNGSELTSTVHKQMYMNQYLIPGVS